MCWQYFVALHSVVNVRHSLALNVVANALHNVASALVIIMLCALCCIACCCQYVGMCWQSDDFYLALQILAGCCTVLPACWNVLAMVIRCTLLHLHNVPTLCALHCAGHSHCVLVFTLCIISQHYDKHIVWRLQVVLWGGGIVAVLN